MKLKSVSLCAVVCALSVAACSKSSSNPTSPSPTAAASGDAAADGSTLKVTAPTAQSPVNAVRLEQADNLTLTVTNGTSKFGVAAAFTYHFQVFNAANAAVVDVANIPQGNGSTSYLITTQLEGDQTYTWRARVELGRDFGPWSVMQSFVVPNSEGYIRTQEIYDPLINGKTVGTIVGPAHFVPGVGLSLDGTESYVYYVLPQTLVEGEFNYLATNVRTNTEGDKTKILAMSDGFDDITTNDRRVTFEKRNDGEMAWRMITHDDQIDTVSAERQVVRFNLTDTFFFGVSWRANFFDTIVKQGGATGTNLWHFGKNWKGRPYDPGQHVLYLGGPGGRAGAASGSVPNIVIRQVWASGRTRPASINK